MWDNLDREGKRESERASDSASVFERERVSEREQARQKERAISMPWRLTPCTPSFSFLKQNLQLISPHCKDRHKLPEDALLNIYARPDAQSR